MYCFQRRLALQPAFSINIYSSFYDGKEKILLFQPQLFFLIFRNVNPLNLKNKGACAVITADDHHSAVICPLAHNGAAMQRCINISADGTLFADSFFSYCWLPVAWMELKHLPNYVYYVSEYILFHCRGKHWLNLHLW